MVFLNYIPISLCLLTCAGNPQNGRNPQKDFLPTKMKLNIDGYMGGGNSLYWEGNTLVYVETLPSEETRTKKIRPRKKAWLKFWNDLEQLGVWQWQREYQNKGPEIQDGSFWSISIEYQGKEISSGGSNAYPPKFRQFQEAVENLSKKLTF